MFRRRGEGGRTCSEEEEREEERVQERRRGKNTEEITGNLYQLLPRYQDILKITVPEIFNAFTPKQTLKNGLLFKTKVKLCLINK